MKAAGNLLDELTALVQLGAAAIAATLSPSLAARLKADRSPVTAADEAAEAAILDGLARLLPGMPVVSEEASSRSAAPALGSTFLLLDPLDGTRELLAGRAEYTINLALIDRGVPVLGVVGAPALGLLWRADEAGAERLRIEPGADPRAAPRAPIRVRPWPSRPVAAVSRSHLDAGTQALVAALPGASTLPCGSALKFCRIAEGEADLYPRLAPTMEWDIAAGHAVLARAGGAVLTPEGDPLRYGGRAHDFRVPGFIAWGDPERALTFGRSRR